MSSDADPAAPRTPKRARGKQRVAELLEGAAAVFAERGYESATMTEIAARAGAPIGSLYQFFPNKEALADTLVQNYVALLSADLEGLESRAAGLDLATLIEQLFTLLRGRPSERAVALPLVEARMDETTRRITFRHMVRKRIATMLKAQAPAVTADAARDMAVVVLQLMKAAHALNDEDSLAGRATAAKELQALAVQYLQQRLP